MDRSPTSDNVLNAKIDLLRGGSPMVLRSACERYGCLITQDSSPINREDVASGIILSTPVSVQSLGHSHQHHHHHHHHHHVAHNYQQNSYSKLEIHTNTQQQQESHERRATRSISTGHTTKAEVKKAELKASAELRSFSDYSSEHEDIESVSESEKTDYTYAKSGSYNSRVTPSRHCPSPNMSRSGLRNFSGSNHSLMSSEESGLTESYRGDLQGSASVKRDLFSGQRSSREYSEQTYSSDQTSFNMYSKDSSVSSSTFSFLSTICHLVYKYICFMLTVDTFILSRCCSVTRKALPLLLFLLLPFLLWLFLTSSTFPVWSQLGAANHLYDWLTVKPSQQTVGNAVQYDSQQIKMLMDMNAKMYKELEMKWAEQATAMESRWRDYSQQMHDWQSNILGSVKDISGPLKVVSQEVEQLKMTIESQIRDEKDASSSTQEELREAMARLRQLEEKQIILEQLFVTMEKCCKDQASLVVGVSQDDLSMQLAAFAKEVRTNVSKLSPPPGASKGTVHEHAEAIHITHKVNSSHYLPTLGDVERLVKVALDRYDADKTGLVDYALESAGGSVISTRCTESYPMGTAQFSLFGVPIWYSANTPRTVIQPQVHPGECWAMRGTQGYLVIQLSASIHPTAFSLEHIPRNLSPTGKIDSAPKDFSVLGLKSEVDTDGQLLGRYTYLDNGDPLQKFSVQETHDAVFSFIELRVHSNHGNPEYTCLYRFRVHGVRQ